MVKKNMTWITIVLTGMIIVLGYFLYQAYIAPIYQNNLSNSQSVSLNQDHQIVLVKHPEQGKIFSLELEITGYSSDILELLIYNPSRTAAYSARIKGGEIDFVYTSDWYEDTCLLDIHPLKLSKDRLTIEYRFIGTK